MERLHILDGHGYIFRAYFALANERGRGSVRLTNRAGMPTAALFVYARMLVRLYLDQRPHRIAVVFDAPGQTFRDQLDEAYKATRRDTPDDLQAQMPYFRPLTEAFAWPVLSVPGVEADDVIATLARQARARDWDVVIYSGDKDLMQLVDDRTVVVDAMRQITYDAARVTEKFGVGPDQLGDWLALVGDTSDNVPGVAGIGKVTATQLLKTYRSLDGVLAGADELAGKLRERLKDAEQLERLALSRELVRLRDDVPLACELDELVAGAWDDARFEELFAELEFKALLEQLGHAQPAPPGASSAPANLPSAAPAGPAAAAPRPVSEVGPLAELVVLAGQARRLALHVEVDDQWPVRAECVGVGLAVPGVAPIYVPMGHRYLGAPPQLARIDFVAQTRGLLEDAGIAKVCYDHKAATTALARLGIDLAGVVCDPMLAAYLLDASTDDYGLARVVRDAVGVMLPERAALLGKGKSARGFEQVAVEAAAAYAGGAASALLGTGDRLAADLQGANLAALAADVELPLAKLLSRIERVGVLVDVSWLRSLSERVSGQLAALERTVNDYAGDAINLGSPKQLGVLLFERLGLRSPRMKKTKTGHSTDFEVLDAMRDLHPIISPILEHRELMKLKGTYIDALPPLVNPETGRIHTSFRQATAATGRLSSTDPNLQNIPIRTPLGREIRRAFIAAPGHEIVSCDYSQIELRLLAHFSADPVLCEAFGAGVDIHTQTAAEVFDLAPNQVGPEERRVAKAVNYGLLYGQSDFGLANALGIGRPEAREIIDRYFARFTKVRSYLQGIIDSARREGVATTILGRRRPIPDLDSRNFQRRSAAERIARNTPLQGSGADILKLAMLRAQAALDDSGADARMLLTVHDELLFEVAAGQAQSVGGLVKREMESVVALRVPLVVDVGVAANWAEAHG
jgi:DNA polymerase-1